MSYCRSSERNCDLYMYHDGKNIHIHVASRRKIPGKRFPSSMKGGMAAWDRCFEPLQNSYAGKNYCAKSQQEALEICEELLENGIRVPKRVLKDLKREIKIMEAS